MPAPVGPGSILGQRHSQGAPQGTQDQTGGSHRPEKRLHSHSGADPGAS